MGLAGSKMTTKSQNRILAAFVLIFLCLNAVGTLCLSYCGLSGHPDLSASETSPAASHCPMHQGKAAEDSGVARLEAMVTACCAVPLGIIPAPAEARFQTSAPALIPAQVALPAEPFLTADPASAEPLPVYRPPPVDRRTDRILHCVIRI